jgi:hypothetical protein
MTPTMTTGLGVTTALALVSMPWGFASAPERQPFLESAWVSPADGGWRTLDTTTTGQSQSRTEPSLSLSAMVTFLKNDSGLTADQLGRLLGVSRRSVHNWAAGLPIAAVHEERLRSLFDLVHSLTALTPEERKNQLLDSSNGPSLFKQFADKAESPQRIKFGVPLEERLGL